MRSEEARFDSLLSNIVDNRGRTCPVTSDPNDRPLIATNCVRNDALYPSYDTERFVSDETYNTWFRGHPEPGDLIFVCKGSPGRVAMAPDPVDFCIAQDMVAIRANSSKIYPPYLLAILRSELMQSRIGNMHVGTLIPHFKKGDFDKLLVPLPDDDVQRAIGDNYLLLSQKIELNRRMNATLEALARALFQSWFVNFDPVRAKAAGQTPAGLDPATADLFPSEFEDSELGEIPKGWRVKRIDEVLTLHYGKSLPEKRRSPGPVPVYGSGGRTGSHNEALVEGPGIIVGRKGSVGTIYWENGDFFPIDTTYFVEPKDGLTLNFSHRILERLGLETMNTDAAVPGLNRENVYRLEITLPPRDLVKRYDKVSSPLREQQRINDAESRTLAALRDALLPVLLSGELPVQDRKKVNGRI